MPKVLRANFLESDVVFCFSSVIKFGSFKNPFATITSLSELYFRFRRLILLVQTWKVVFINYGSSTSCWKPWRWARLDDISCILHLIYIYLDEIYIYRSIPTWTHSQNSLEAAEVLSLEISSHGKSLKW